MSTEEIVNNRQNFRLAIDKHMVGKTNYMDTIVCILDISAGGMGFQTNMEIDIGRQFSITINALDKDFTMKGIVVRKVLSENQDNYLYGFRSLHDEREKTPWVKLVNDLSIMKKKQPWKVKYKQCKCRPN